MERDLLLNLLGNETRRDILQILAQRSCYVSELSQVLDIGQKAIIKHLELMHGAGILDINYEKIEKGRPRKYYQIAEDIVLEVKISPYYFDVETLLPELEEEVLESFPKLGELMERMEKASSLEGREKIEEYRELHGELSREMERINRTKRVIGYLQKELRDEIKKESLRELERLFY